MEEEIDREALRIANQHTSPLQANQLALEITQIGNRKVDKIFRYMYITELENDATKPDWEKDYEAWKKEMKEKIGG